MVDGFIGFMQIAYDAGIRKGASEKAISNFEEWLEVNLAAILLLLGCILTIFIECMVVMWIGVFL